MLGGLKFGLFWLKSENTYMWFNPRQSLILAYEIR